MKKQQMEMPDEYISVQGCFNCEWDNSNGQCPYRWDNSNGQCRKGCGYEDYKEWTLKFMYNVEVEI